MLKSYDELRKIDVSPYCEARKEKINGKEVKIPYLNWAKCIDLLHENGAKEAYFEPVPGPNGSSLIKTDATFKDSNDNTNSAYETRVRVIIDNLEFEFQGPVMNGANPVKDNSMSQQRLWNCQCRLFVKAVAIRTGLGFDLWISSEQAERELQRQGEIHHDIMKVRERVLEEFTVLNKRGMTKSEIAQAIGMDDDELDMKFKMYASLAKMENELVRIIHEKQ